MTLGRHEGFGEAEYSRRWPAMIDASARVTHGCRIGAETRVWQFASVIRGAVVGESCSIGACAIIDGAKVGNRVAIGSGAFIPPGTEIKDDVFIGPQVCICNDAWPSTSKEGFDMGAVLSGTFVTVRIEAHASIGAGVIILPGVVISEHARIAAGAIVTKDVPPHHIYKRNGEMAMIDLLRRTGRMRKA